MIKVYDTATDTMIEVTQEWCDNAVNAMQFLAQQRKEIKEILDRKMPPLKQVKEIVVTSLVEA